MFKRYCEVKPNTFQKIVELYAHHLHKSRRKAGRPPKLSVEDQILMTLEYWREYRTYFAHGVPGTPAGVWQSLSVTWRDQAEWRFIPFSSGVYALQRMTNRVGRGLQFAWRADRSLSQVSDLTSGAVLLTLSYGQNNKLTSAVDAYGRRVNYTFSTPTLTDPGKLSFVSQVGGVSANPPAHWTYTYSTANHQ